MKRRGRKGAGAGPRGTSPNGSHPAPLPRPRTPWVKKAARLALLARPVGGGVGIVNAAALVLGLAQRLGLGPTRRLQTSRKVLGRDSRGDTTRTHVGGVTGGVGGG